MNNKFPVSIILPIKSSKSKNFEEYFNKAIQSIHTQKVGIEELGYQGNTPNVWDGVPEEVLKEQYRFFTSPFNGKVIFAITKLLFRYG